MDSHSPYLAQSGGLTPAWHFEHFMGKRKSLIFISCSPAGVHMDILWGPQDRSGQRSVSFKAPEICIFAGKCIGKCVEVPKINWL